MPEVFIFMVEGRSTDAKRAAVKEITDTFEKHLGFNAESVVIQIFEASKDNKAKGGKLFSDR